MKKRHLFSRSRQCSSTPVGLSQGFLSKEQCNSARNSSILFWPDSSWILSFPRLQSALKWRRFCDATDTIKNATDELKRPTQNGSQERFQHIYSRWQKCVVTQRGLFWRKCSLHDCSAFCISFTVDQISVGLRKFYRRVKLLVRWGVIMYTDGWIIFILGPSGYYETSVHFTTLQGVWYQEHFTWLKYNMKYIYIYNTVKHKLAFY